MEEKIKAGDVVQLKSGGPKMTVKMVDRWGADDFDSAACDWFVTDGKGGWKKEEGIYALTSLQLA